MQLRFDREKCVGMLACIPEWEAFEQPDGEFKPVLVDGEEVDDEIYVVDVPDDVEEKVRSCEKVCPVDAIEIVEVAEH